MNRVAARLPALAKAPNVLVLAESAIVPIYREYPAASKADDPAALAGSVRGLSPEKERP